MQTAAKERSTSRRNRGDDKLYGFDDPETRDYGTRCLIARRLVERGVRFVQIFIGDQSWDHHGHIRKALPACCNDRSSRAPAWSRI